MLQDRDLDVGDGEGDVAGVADRDTRVNGGAKDFPHDGRRRRHSQDSPLAYRRLVNPLRLPHGFRGGFRDV